MATKQDALKQLAAEKKVLNDKQKEIRDELNASREERKAARKIQAANRKLVVGYKKDLRDLSATIYTTFSKGSSEEILALADELTETAAELATCVREFGEAAASLEEL